MKPRVPTLAFAVVAVAIAATAPLVIAADATPKFEIDASWPKPLPNNWFTSDDPNGQIHILRRSDGAVAGSFGRVGRGPGEFENLHNIAIDSKGNIYTAEVQGQRVQRFRYKGGLPPIK